MRVFFAVRLSEEIQDRLCSVLHRLRPCCAKGRFTPRENLHVTLVFLGETAPERLPETRAAMEAVSAEPFSLHIGGMGCFRRSGGDLYWAGVERSAPLCRLYDSLCGELQKRGFPTDDRPYRPHLTLVRQAVLSEGCDRGAFVVPAMRMKVEKFSLMKSEQAGGRRLYTEIGAKNLERA
jgi:2'-5' RNA ligase